MGLAFLNYRRDDTGAAAQAIYAQMKVNFGSGQLFMDVNSIPIGGAWPDYLRQRVESASGLVVLIGRDWLRVADEYGRRRIDLPGDWVASEIRTALERQMPIVPVLVGEDVRALSPDALPESLASLAFKQVTYLRPKSWVQDIAQLIATVKDQCGLLERMDLRGIVGPHPDARKAKLPEVKAEVLADFLRAHPGWEPWEDSLAREYPATRTELRKNFTFASFTDAADFMHEASAYFEAQKHHPRWSNEWRLVIVGLTTWDAKNRITERDLQVAEGLDVLFREFQERRRERPGQ